MGPATRQPTLRFSNLRTRGVLYWSTLAFTIGASLLASDLLNRTSLWQTVRFSTFRALQKLSDRRTHAEHTRLVLIDDVDYYSKEVYRSPLPRDYIAGLVTKIADAEPQVIALDIGLQKNPGDEKYAVETEALRKALVPIKATTTIVFASVVARDPKSRIWKPRPNVIDEQSLPNGNGVTGFTELADEISEIKVWLPVARRVPIVSFATAIARAADRQAVDDVIRSAGEETPFSTFMPEAYFRTLKPGDLISKDAVDLMKHHIVIVGGKWHRDGNGTGPQVDSYDTPVGNLNGALVHANYVEAMLSPGGTKHGMRERTRTALEIFLALAVALSFVIFRLRARLVLLAFLGLAVVGLSVFSWQMNGVFFDGVMSLTLLLGHAELERRGIFERQPHTLRRGLVWAMAAIVIAIVVVRRQAVHAEFVADRPGMVVKVKPPAAVLPAVLEVNNSGPQNDRASERRRRVGGHDLRQAATTTVGARKAESTVATAALPPAHGGAVQDAVAGQPVDDVEQRRAYMKEEVERAVVAEMERQRARERAQEEAAERPAPQSAVMPVTRSPAVVTVTPSPAVVASAPAPDVVTVAPAPAMVSRSVADAKTRSYVDKNKTWAESNEPLHLENVPADTSLRSLLENALKIQRFSHHVAVGAFAFDSAFDRAPNRCDATRGTLVDLKTVAYRGGLLVVLPKNIDRPELSTARSRLAAASEEWRRAGAELSIVTTMDFGVAAPEQSTPPIFLEFGTDERPVTLFKAAPDSVLSREWSGFREGASLLFVVFDSRADRCAATP